MILIILFAYAIALPMAILITLTLWLKGYFKIAGVFLYIFSTVFFGAAAYVLALLQTLNLNWQTSYNMMMFVDKILFWAESGGILPTVEAVSCKPVMIWAASGIIYIPVFLGGMWCLLCAKKRRLYLLGLSVIPVLGSILLFGFLDSRQSYNYASQAAAAEQELVTVLADLEKQKIANAEIVASLKDSRSKFVATYERKSPGFDSMKQTISALKAIPQKQQQ